MRILKQISSIMQHSISLLIRSIDQTQLSDLLLPFLHLFLVNPEDKFQSGKNTNTFRPLVRESPSLFFWNSHNQSLLIFITDLLEHCFPRLKQLRYLRKIPNITRNSTNQNRRSRRFETLYHLSEAVNLFKDVTDRKLHLFRSCNFRLEFFPLCHLWVWDCSISFLATLIINQISNTNLLTKYKAERE